MSQSKIYVGNLSYGVDNAMLTTACSEFGEITELNIITDRDTGQSKGFGFVTFTSDTEANAAVEGLNGVELDGRALRVNIARPKEEGGRGGRGGFGGGRGEGGGRGGRSGGSW